METFFDSRKVPLKWIHKPSVWDAVLWLSVFPIALWVCYRLAPLVEASLAKYSGFLEAAAYVYIVTVSITACRTAFHYARWLWPRAEYVAASNKALRHRLILGAIVISVIGAVLYDLIKVVLNTLVYAPK